MRTACEFQESSTEWKVDLKRIRQGGNILWHVAQISVTGKVCPVPASRLWHTTAGVSSGHSQNTAAAISVYGQPWPLPFIIFPKI